MATGTMCHAPEVGAAFGGALKAAAAAWGRAELIAAHGDGLPLAHLDGGVLEAVAAAAHQAVGVDGRLGRPHADDGTAQPLHTNSIPPLFSSPRSHRRAAMPQCQVFFSSPGQFFELSNSTFCKLSSRFTGPTLSRRRRHPHGTREA